MEDVTRRGFFGLLALAGASAVVTALPSTAHAAVAASPVTPSEWALTFYKLGITVSGRSTVIDGRSYQFNLTRIRASDGGYYATMELDGNIYAISERDAAVWNTNNDPQGDTRTWTFATLEIVYLVARLWQIATYDFLSIMTFLILIALVLIVILILIKMYWDIKNKQTRDRFRSEDQWHNALGIPMWMFPENEIAGHPSSFLGDMRFLAGANPALNTQFRAEPNVNHWLNTGQLPAQYMALT